MENNLNQMKSFMSEDAISKPGCSIVLSGLANQLLISLTKIRSGYRQVVADAEDQRINSEGELLSLEYNSEIEKQEAVSNATQLAYEGAEYLDQRSTAAMHEMSLRHDQEMRTVREGLLLQEARNRSTWQDIISDKDMQLQGVHKALKEQREASGMEIDSLKSRAEAAEKLVQQQSDQIKEKDRTVKELGSKLKETQETMGLQKIALDAMGNLKQVQIDVDTLISRVQVSERTVGARDQQIREAGNLKRQSERALADVKKELLESKQEVEKSSKQITSLVQLNQKMGSDNETLKSQKIELQNRVTGIRANLERLETAHKEKVEQLTAMTASHDRVRDRQRRFKDKVREIETMKDELKGELQRKLANCVNAHRDTLQQLFGFALNIEQNQHELNMRNIDLTTRLDCLVRGFERQMFEQRQQSLAEKSQAARQHGQDIAEAIARTKAIYTRGRTDFDGLIAGLATPASTQVPPKRRAEVLEDDSPSSNRGLLHESKRPKTIAEPGATLSQVSENTDQDESGPIRDGTITIDNADDDHQFSENDTDNLINSLVDRFSTGSDMLRRNTSSPLSRSDDTPTDGYSLSRTDGIVNASHSLQVIDPEEDSEQSNSHHADTVETTTDQAANQTTPDDGVQVHPVPPPPSPPFVAPTSTDPSDLADAIFSLFYPMWDITDQDEADIKVTWRSAFRAGKTFTKAIEELDRHVLGTNWSKPPEYPRGCMMADVTSKNHGPGGFGMSQDSCPYCGRRSKTKRFCQWALLAPGLELGFRDRVDGRLATDQRDYTDQMNNLTTVLGGRRVRYLLFKRREAGEGNYTVPVKIVDGVRLPPQGTS